MASAQTSLKKESTWELSKENVKPVRSGRNVNCIAAVLQPSKEDMEQLMKEKQLFEEEIIAGANAEDPLEPWDRYLHWTIQYFPSGGNDLTLMNLLKKLIAKFNSMQYRNDIRYVKAWLKLAEILKDPFETYSYMNTEGIGTECAELYIAWADEYEKYGDMKRADRVYNNGDEKCAQPRELLQQMHMEFQLRAARLMVNHESQEEEDNYEADSRTQPQQRTAFGNLKGRGKSRTVGVQRTGRATKPLQSFGLGFGNSTGQKMPQSGGFEIYEDEAPKNINVMGEVGQWTNAPTRDSGKENTIKAGPWRDAKMKRNNGRSQVTSTLPVPNAVNFTVYDEGQECSSTPRTAHKIATNVESVLSVKKETKDQLNEYESIFNAKPIQDANIRCAYDVDQVFTAMGEMQFEEVRAAHWRRRQRIQRERQLFEQNQKIEEERRKLDEEKMQMMEERMRLMELERNKLKLERKLMESKRKRMLENPNNSTEGDQMLVKEEEDITIQLNSVKRDINKANMALAQGIEPVEDFVEKENELQDRQQILMTVPMKTASSANSSLNLSKRSQPSPTVNTKEAMNQLDSWFQKPLDDFNGLADSVIVPEGFNNEMPQEEDNQPFSFRPINNIAQLAPQSIFGAKSDDAPFVIYNDENENSSNRATTRPLPKRKGLAELPIPQKAPQTVSQPVIVENNRETLSHTEEDKTGYCFDDVTVAGNNFADKAHLASTPFCSKYEKFQDMTHINHISRIQPELTVTENIANYRSDPVQEENKTTEQRTEYTDGDGMLYATKINDAPEPVEGKQLSPIMEASNESDKSVMGTTIKSTTEMDQFQSQFPVFKKNSIQEPINMKSFGSELSKTNDFGLPNTRTKKSGEYCYDDFLDFGSIDCNLWDDNEKKKSAVNIELENDNVFSKTSVTENVFISQGIQEKPITKELDNICEDFSSTSIKGNQKGIENYPSLANSIPDPWDEDLLNSIMKKNGLLAKNCSITVNIMEENMMPKLRRGTQISLGSREVRVGQVMGEGAYAKVFDVVSTNDEDCHQVVKAQMPACPWEVYAVSHAKSRLQSKGMTDIAEAIVDIKSAHFFKDGSVLLMPYLSKGTLLDVVNSNRGNIMKDAVAIWTAYQVMRIVNSLHTVGIIHGDIKPDNFMVVPFNSSDLTESLSRVDGIMLIDFGRAIDMTEMPQGSSFIKNCCTSAFTCIQMQNKAPWNYHTDFYGIAGTLHVMLFGSYMKVRRGKNGRWEIQDRIKRWYNTALWKDFFDTLLNFPTPTEDRPITDSPLPRLISEMEHLLNDLDTQFNVITSFFNGRK